MLTLPFIHNFAPKKFKSKTMDRKTKAFTGKVPCSSPSRIPFSSKEAQPHRKPCGQRFGTKKLYTGEIMSASAVPKAESNKDLLVDNPKPNLGAK